MAEKEGIKVYSLGSDNSLAEAHLKSGKYAARVADDKIVLIPLAFVQQEAYWKEVGKMMAQKDIETANYVAKTYASPSDLTPAQKTLVSLLREAKGRS